MAVDYELVCRRGELGPLLSAAFLAGSGDCRILVLPPRLPENAHPGFLVPVLRGYPAELLGRLVSLETVPDNLLSWRKNGSGGSWSRIGGGAAERDLETVFGSAAPEVTAWAELERLWALLDECMRRGLEMPVSSLSGSGRMLWLVVRNELLRESRKLRLSHWLAASGVPAGERDFWRALAPLVTLARFADPPLLAFAYGVMSLAASSGWLAGERLEAHLCRFLRSRGAEFIGDDWSPVFDGKWYVGVGNNRKTSRRSTVFLADSNPVNLLGEVESGLQRRDFRKQFEIAAPGFAACCEPVESRPETGEGLYHLECQPAGDPLSGSRIFYNDFSVPDHHRRVGLGWEPLSGGAAFPEAGCWGWEPKLPAMMGGGFLPLRCGFMRFYQVGWHNLPGLGFGGLVYSAWQVARTVWIHDLQRRADDFGGGQQLSVPGSENKTNGGKSA